MNAASQESAHDAGAVGDEVQNPGEVAAAIAPPSVPEQVPREIISMIFTEFLSKPAVHFAEMRMSTTQHGTLDGTAVTLHEWSNGELKSGYLAADVLNATSKSVRDTVGRATFEPSGIKYANRLTAEVQVDASTDLLCLVIPGRFPPFPCRCCHSPEQHAAHISQNFGTIRRAGMLVTEAMWNGPNGVISSWFNPVRYDGEIRYNIEDGRLRRGTLGWLMKSFKNLQAFYLVLTDITAEDWEEYYQSKSHFPIAFHDHHGSYVEIYDQGIHPSVMKKLWSRSDRDLYRYPFPHRSENQKEPNLNLDSSYPKRVDSQMSSQLRVQLLLGILSCARWKANNRVPTEEPKIGILVRRPAWVMDDKVPKVHRPPMPIPAHIKFYDERLRTEDPEAVWVKQALDHLLLDPEDEYPYYSHPA